MRHDTNNDNFNLCWFDYGDTMKLKGKVLWYDKKEQNGVIQEDDGFQFFVQHTSLVDTNYLDAGDLVFFKKQDPDTMNAVEVELQQPIVEEECDHEWDSSEGGMCINCGREDYYNFIDEDYGQER